MKYLITSKISENISETPEGFLVCIAVPIARTGEMLYDKSEIPHLEPDKNGKIRITRSEKEVFRPQTMASFEAKALTIRHPEDWVGPDNWKELAVGTLQNIRRDKDDLIADLLITDSMAIGLVKNGLREVSCGYECDYEQDENEPGTAIQKNIIGNHLALVDQGRAGPEYAITDHKGEKNMDFKDRIKAIFGKAQDEALKVADEAAKTTDAEGKKDKVGAECFDELVKMVKDIGEKVSAMKKDSVNGAEGTVVKKEGKADDEEEEKGEDEEEDKEKSKDDAIEERLKTLEAALEKILAKMGDEYDDEEEEKGEDEEEEKADDEDMDDDDFENSSMVGDSAEVLSRAEILAPGLKKSKDLVVKALKTCYGTKEGKKVIDSLTGGKPTFDSKDKVQTLFIAASEIFKAGRQEEFSKTKRKVQDDDFKSSFHDTSAMTPEKLNEINSKFYKNA